MKIKKFNENVENEYHLIISRDHMGTYYTDIFETKKDLIDYFIPYAEKFIREIYENYDDDSEEIVDDAIMELIEIDDINELIDKFSEIISDGGSEENFYYSTGKLLKPEMSKEEYIKKWELKRNVKKYNL